MAGAEDREVTFMVIGRDVALDVDRGAIDKPVAMDMLYELAQAHGLVSKLGNDRVQEIMARAFGWHGFPAG